MRPRDVVEVKERDGKIKFISQKLRHLSGREVYAYSL